MENIEILTHPGHYSIVVDGVDAGEALYVENGTVRDFNHTVIDSAYQGRGLSTRLIKAALDATRQDGFSVIASCSAVDAFIKKHPEYQSMLAGR